MEWLDGASGVSIGARFHGHNHSSQMGEWHTEPEVVEVDPAAEGTIVRQWAKVGSGKSPFSDFIEQHPDREGEIVAYRLGVWRDGMTANLSLIEKLAADQN